MFVDIIRPAMDTKGQIANYVREIDRVSADKENLWRMIRKCIQDDHVDDAISLLNRYFGMKERIERVETDLQGLLKAQLADK